jgi:hypothetical protein
MTSAPTPFLFCLLAAVATAQAKRPPNVLVIVTDDQRPDTMRALASRLE